MRRITLFGDKPVFKETGHVFQRRGESWNLGSIIRRINSRVHHFYWLDQMVCVYQTFKLELHIFTFSFDLLTTVPTAGTLGCDSVKG